MKKTTKLTLFATALFAAMAFTACSDDDNDNSNKKPGSLAAATTCSC